MEVEPPTRRVHGVGGALVKVHQGRAMHPRRAAGRVHGGGAAAARARARQVAEAQPPARRRSRQLALRPAAQPRARVRLRTNCSTAARCTRCAPTWRRSARRGCPCRQTCRSRCSSGSCSRPSPSRAPTSSAIHSPSRPGRPSAAHAPLEYRCTARHQRPPRERRGRRRRWWRRWGCRRGQPRILAVNWRVQCVPRSRRQSSCVCYVSLSQIQLSRDELFGMMTVPLTRLARSSKLYAHSHTSSDRRGACAGVAPPHRATGTARMLLV